MALTPFGGLGFGRDLFSPTEEMFGSLFGPLTTRGETTWARGLPVDVIEKDKTFEVRADIPGVNKEDIKVTVDAGNVLNIQVDKKEEKKEEGATWRRYERTQNFASRSLRFPETANLDNVKARYENGVLHLDLPKKEKKEEKGRIQIQ